jgi:exopolyphosphatase/guanosine-5'-triphosphate,3'-diphosphate pyrophosphatase
MARKRVSTLKRRRGPRSEVKDRAVPVAVIDIGASAVRLLVAETTPGGPPRILDEASRGVLLGKDTFTSGRLGAPSIEAALKALQGFRRLMDDYGVEQYRAVATSAVREAQNRDTFLDRVRLRTGLEVEIIDGSEENRLTYLAVREALRGHEALTTADALLVEVGGGSADLSFLRQGVPTYSGTYALGAIRMRQNLLSWEGSSERQAQLLRRHIHNVVDDIRREMPLGDAAHFIALGGDVRFAAGHAAAREESGPGVAVIGREAFEALAERFSAESVDALAQDFRLPPVEAETLGPALLAYCELLRETKAAAVVIPDASLRAGLLLDLAGTTDGLGTEVFRSQVLASAAALGEKYRYDAPHARQVARLSVELFDAMLDEHGLSDRDRLLLEVAALLHDVGIYVSLRAHHKHSLYLLQAAEIFGLSRDDMAIVANVARYHRRGLPQKSHLPYVALDREARTTVNKLAAILRLANALDADHLAKVRKLRLVLEEDAWVLELDGASDLTMERLASQARADYLTEVFGHRLELRETSR